MEHLLFVTSGARKHIKMSIALVCTQVKVLDEDDWGNLVRVLRYITGTLHLPFILRSNIISVIKWWVDASFAAQPNCKGATRVMMSMGSGLIMELSRKQKINGRSSTEAEIVG